jgi:hypothetical protein
MNKRNTLIAITSFTASFVALTAAFFSVTGIAKLFAGATISVLIMASALEFGKIVAISFLYQYWTELPKILKGYLLTASVILMMITSLGIYGFLSGAYQVTADQLQIIDQQVAVVEMKKVRYQEELVLAQQDRNRLSSNVQELSRGLANNQQQYRDARTGQILTTSSAGNRTVLQRQLDQTTSERSRLADRIESLSDSITSLDVQILEMSMSNEVAAEVGPLRFISSLLGWSMDQVVNVFALLIVLVFDPLAVALVVSVNFLIKTNVPKHSGIYENIEPDDTEPYEIYTAPSESSTETSVMTNELHDPWYFTRKNFDWHKEHLWKHNSQAVRYYNTRIKPNKKTS